MTHFDDAASEPEKSSSRDYLGEISSGTTQLVLHGENKNNEINKFLLSLNSCICIIIIHTPLLVKVSHLIKLYV